MVLTGKATDAFAEIFEIITEKQIQTTDTVERIKATLDISLSSFLMSHTDYVFNIVQ
jgi:hypothetical protein